MDEDVIPEPAVILVKSEPLVHESEHHVRACTARHGIKRPASKEVIEIETDAGVSSATTVNARLKGSLSGDARDFNNIEIRAVIKFFFLQGKVPKEIHAILTETLGQHAPSYATVKNWVAQFKRGDFSTCDAPRPGRPKTVTTPEIIDKIHGLISEDHRISAKSIAEQLGVSRERVGSIIHEDLDMRN